MFTQSARLTFTPNCGVALIPDVSDSWPDSYKYFYASSHATAGGGLVKVWMATVCLHWFPNGAPYVHPNVCVCLGSIREIMVHVLVLHKTKLEKLPLTFSSVSTSCTLLKAPLHIAQTCLKFTCSELVMYFWSFERHVYSEIRINPADL